MNETRKTRPGIKSRIAMKKGSTLQNKENVPEEANKKGAGTARKTLSSRKNDNAQAHPVVKSKRTKGAPDFDKLHKKWEVKLAKGKAVTKRANTKIEPFNLTKEVCAMLEPDINLDEDLLDVDVEEPVYNSVQGSEIVQETATKCCSCGKSKQQQEVSTPITNKSHNFKVPRSIRRNNVSSVKTKQKKVEFEEDPAFEFKPDHNALQSILNNDGIRSTPRSRTTGTYCSPSPFSQKRTSIYYTGPRPDRSPSAFEKRLSMRRAAATMAKMRQAESTFEPSKTLVGVHEFGNRFTTTPIKEFQYDNLANPESIPSEEETTPNAENEMIAHALASTENEITWADTLKHYSHAKQENCSPAEAEEALIAQLEEEVRQTIENVALYEHTNFPSEDHSLPNPSACKSDIASISNHNISIPLQQRRDKPSIYRKLFVSPFSERLQNNTTVVEADDLNPAYLYTTTSSSVDVNTPRNLPEVDGLLAQEGYQTKPVSMTNPRSRDLGRPPSNSLVYGLPKETENEYMSQRFRMAKGVTFSPCVDKTSRHILLQDAGLHTASKTGIVNKEKSARSTFNSVEKATSGKHWSVEPTIKEKKSEKHVSLVAAASASLNSKLRSKALEANSAFKKIKPPNAEMSSYAKSSCTSVSEQKLLVPTPIRPEVPQGAASSEFILRHRQIMHEALVKSRDYAQEILLDAEVSLYARNINLLSKSDFSDKPRVVNPLAKLFNEGDEKHFVPMLA